ILFREWQVKGRKLEQAQLELIYSTSKNWQEKWLAGKELGLKQAAQDVYENKDAEREDRMEASKILGISPCDFALHERKLGKELKKEDLKQIWIHAKDLDVRNAAAAELGHSATKIWMSEHPEVVVGAGVVFLVLVAITVIWRPWRHFGRAKLADTPSEQAAAAPRLVVTNSNRRIPSPADAPSPVAAPSQTSAPSSSVVSPSSGMSSASEKPTATTTLPATKELSTSTSTLGKLPDDPAEKVDLAGMMSSSSAATKSDPTVAPPDLPDIPDDQPEDTTGSTSNALPTSPVSPVSAPKPVVVIKSTNVAGVVSNKLPAITSPVPKVTVTSGPTGKVVKVVSPVAAATNAPKPVLVVKSTNVVGTISNKIQSTAAAPAKVIATTVATGKVVKAVAPVSISTNALRPSTIAKPSIAVKISTNTLPQKVTVPATALVPSTSTNAVVKAIVPTAVPAGKTE
ncbi:MAG: hypothetical protein WCN95_03205, partial [bacterium]